MVAKAISLYRGSLHKLPPKSPPRRWVLPRPKISLNDFRRLLLRRSKVLSLRSATNPSFGPTSAPPLSEDEEQHQATLLDQLNGAGNANLAVEPSKSTALFDEAVLLLISEDMAEIAQNPALECSDKLDAGEQKQRRREEVEEKLFILNEKKHKIVQALKQILNAEEELKRQSNVQTSCPHIPLQVNLSKNSGSMMRHTTHRTGPDANFTVNMEEREGDDVLNHGQWSRQSLPMNSMSPSAESALKRLPYPQHNLDVTCYKKANAIVGRQCCLSASLQIGSFKILWPSSIGSGIFFFFISSWNLPPKAQLPRSEELLSTLSSELPNYPLAFNSQYQDWENLMNVNLVYC